ncbi:hypothetical protein ACOZCI_26530 [Streptomyces griseoincarnatus]
MEGETDELAAIPDHATAAAWNYYRYHFAQIQYMTSANLVFGDYESLLERLGVAFSEIAPDGPEALFPHWFRRRDFYKATLNKNLPIIAEYGMTRCIENFLSYVSEILTEVLSRRPHLLKSQEQVTYEEVLAHDSIEEFAAWAAERRVSQLSFKGLEEIAVYIEKRLGLALHDNDSDWRTLRRGVAIRNLVVHRRGIADDRFVRTVRDAEKGKRYEFTLKDYINVAVGAKRVVQTFDEKVAEKFGLPRTQEDADGFWRKGVWASDSNSDT